MLSLPFFIQKQHVINHFDEQVKPPSVCCDNLSMVLPFTNPVLSVRRKHVEVDLVHGKVIQTEVEAPHVPFD